uniref:Uncharacterized protein n=1 Tax=Glossina austeni TaxID=7395 RepID=A0A1A9UEP8_GLOAU
MQTKLPSKGQSSQIRCEKERELINPKEVEGKTMEELWCACTSSTLMLTDLFYLSRGAASKTYPMTSKINCKHFKTAFMVSLTAAGGFFTAFPFQVIGKPFVLQRIKLDHNKNYCIVFMYLEKCQVRHECNEIYACMPMFGSNL